MDDAAVEATDEDDVEEEEEREGEGDEERWMAGEDEVRTWAQMSSISLEGTARGEEGAMGTGAARTGTGTKTEIGAATASVSTG